MTQTFDDIVAVLRGGEVLAFDVLVETSLADGDLPGGGGDRHGVLVPAEGYAVVSGDRSTDCGNNAGGGGGELGNGAPVGGVALIVGGGDADATHLPLIAGLGNQVGEREGRSAGHLNADTLVVEVGSKRSVADLPSGGSGRAGLGPAEVGGLGIDILGDEVGGDTAGGYRHHLDVVDIDVVRTESGSHESHAGAGGSLNVLVQGGEGLPSTLSLGTYLLQSDECADIVRVGHIADDNHTVGGSGATAVNLQREL